MSSVWTRSALRGALLATAIALALALSAGLVRIVPWLLDPSVSWRVASPFARSLAVVAVEAALAVGWPVGWTLATLTFVERGEARVARLLGERPLRTVARLAGQGLGLALALGAVSWASARESTEPGRIVSELIADGEAACARADTPRTYTVPFFGATWLCDRGMAPRLVGQAPGPLAAVVFSARDARASGDLGDLELTDAHLALAHAGTRVRLHVDSLRIHGTAPWGHASTVAPTARALSLALAVSFAAIAAVTVVLLGHARGRVSAVLTGAVGPIMALGLLRAAERFPSSGSSLVLLAPLLGAGATVVIAWSGARLPTMWHTASRWRGGTGA
jgi:hypothetical protein